LQKANGEVLVWFWVIKVTLLPSNPSPLQRPLSRCIDLKGFLAIGWWFRNWGEGEKIGSLVVMTEPEDDVDDLIACLKIYVKEVRRRNLKKFQL